jgi:hypothetical protein
MRSPTTLKWVGLALLGLLIAAGVSIAASRLASQQIGLASEPISAGDTLAPAARPHGKRRHLSGPAKTPTVTTPTTTTTTQPPPATIPETVAPTSPPEEPSHSSGGEGEHGGGGGGHADD